MRNALIFSTLLMLTVGCVSKSEARRQAHEAFMAGQLQSVAAATARSQPAGITFRGDVKNETLPWTDDLTLTQAIVSAEYQGMNDPSRIVITRNGQTIQVKPRDLLHGKDVPLEPGDIIDLQH